MSTEKTLADVQPGGRVRLGDQAERARFEAWASAEGLNAHIHSANGMYSHPVARGAWLAWQRLSAQPSPGGQDALDCIGRIEEAIEFRVPHDIYAAVHGELAELKAALAARQPVDEVSVKKEDANNYCLILRALGMEEEGDPVAEVKALIDARDRQPVGELVAVAYGPISLPPVPHGQVMPPDDRTGLYPVAHDDEAMQDYAREAVEADREQLAAGVAHVRGAVLIDGTVHLIQKGEEMDWVYGHVDGRKANLLYTAAPAQAVDLGQFHALEKKWRDQGIEHGTRLFTGNDHLLFANELNVVIKSQEVVP